MNTDKLEKLEEISLLLDFYGELLSEKQREFLRLYHEDNLSLSEIGEAFGVSRQAVSDGVKKAETALRSYEDKLHLIANYENCLRLCNELFDSIGSLQQSRACDRPLCTALEQIKGKLTELNR
ncbi:MAG: YlxM family DNA-binding protein [Firmicutes bacterium]|nr:YlxM family DNA-binding protein [Bacillota bacterium]